MSTLPPPAVYSTDVPTVSYPGESEASAKNDPNSPQALMRKTKQMEVQSAVDSQYDTNVPAHEGFECRCKRGLLVELTLFVILIAILLTVAPKRFQTMRIVLWIVLIGLFALVAVLASGLA